MDNHEWQINDNLHSKFTVLLIFNLLQMIVLVAGVLYISNKLPIE